ncbi:MAG TPA: M1 family aminopeptidase [bacterium]|jgi:hypothetical protein
MYLKSLILAILASTLVFAAPRQTGPWGTPTPNSELRHRLHSRAGSLDDDSLHRYDMLEIHPTMSMNPDSQIFRSSVIYTVRASQIPLDRVDLRFTESLTMDSVWSLGETTVTYTRDGLDSLQILLSPAVPLHDTVEFGIAYHGNPAIIDSWGGFRFVRAQGDRGNMGFSMGDGLNLDLPPANYNWLPSYADPTDKVLWDAETELSRSQTATQFMTVGMPVSVDSSASRTVWHYRLDQPVSTYLLAISAGNYRTFVQRTEHPLIMNWVYPNHLAAAQIAYANVPAVLDSFSARFGPYPFDRFGYAMTPIGDMEHATCVFHVENAVQANHTYDWLLFHEMSHQWWGDWVTCGDWRDLWLNEGFGTYCEALGMEALGGHAAYQDYVETDLFPAALTTNENFPIYNPDYYWGSTVYEKGACVMHMLRQLLGDTAFFDAWREYGQEHAFGNAVTAEWQLKLEEHYGGSLQWFFDEWVYTGTRYPLYHVLIDLIDIPVFHIAQTQTTGTLFRMPVDVRVSFANRPDSVFTVWNDATADQTFELTGLTDIRGVQIDPGNKILKRATYTYLGTGTPLSPALPKEFRITSVSPNPFNSAAVVRFDLPKSATVRLRVFDLLGREQTTRDLGSLPAGTHQVAWDGTNAASGVYLFRLESEQECRVAKAILLK